MDSENSADLFDALKELTTTFALLEGDEYYQALSHYLTEHFGFDAVFIGKYIDTFESINIVSAVVEGDAPQNTIYDLKYSPSNNLTEDGYVICSRDFEHKYPQDDFINSFKTEAFASVLLRDKNNIAIGQLIVLGFKPFEDPRKIKQILNLYATNISVELSRHATQLSHDDLKSIAYYDPLTKLPNRILIKDRIKTALASHDRDENLVVICLMDLDGFKEVNDTYGHDAGDYVLVEVARRVQDVLRADDTIARLGGDEFIILLQNMETSDAAARVLLRILQSVSANYHFQGNIINSISASIGVSIYPDDNADSDMLIKHADSAMYKAKKNGKNQFQFFDLKEHMKVKANFKALKKIETAIERGEFELYLQSKLSGHSLNIESVEVLTRWNHPILGLIQPDEFLPLIENDELVYKFDEWVIRESIQMIQRLQKKGINLVLSVNISPKQFKQLSFVDKIKRIATELNVKPSDFQYLEFEIVESSILESFNHTNETMCELQKLGIRFALDDFGTGYSSLTHLKELQINTIKIDKCFVQDMLLNSQDMAIVNAIISLSKVFQVEVVAEGAESIEQLLMLFELGCDYVQGYTVSKPVSYNDFLLYMQDFSHDPRWKVASHFLPRRGDFELLLAQSNHKYWIELIVDALKRGDYSNLPQLSHNSCRLGSWLTLNGKKYFSELKGYNKLIGIHKKVHEEVQEIIELYQESEAKVPQEVVDKIFTMRNELIEVIDELKDQFNKKKFIEGG